MSDEVEGRSRSPIRIEAESPDPPQIRRPEPEPPGLLRKSLVAGAVAGLISSFSLCGCGTILLNGVGPPGDAMLVASILSLLCGIGVWISFVIFRRRLFARRPRRRSRY